MAARGPLSLYVMRVGPAILLCAVAAWSGGCGASEKDPQQAPERPAFDPAQATPEQVALGRSLYQYKGCLLCHSLDGKKLVGPSLKGLYGSEQWLTTGEKIVVDSAYLRRSLLDPDGEVVEGYPKGQMVNYRDLLTDEEIDALIAFIGSLSGEGAAEDAGGDLSVREDGRPSWWFDGVQREGGRVTVCGEGLGADLVRARSVATDDARGALRAELGAKGEGPVAGEVADLQTVWPLPNAGGELRYAAYVMLSAPEARGE